MRRERAQARPAAAEPPSQANLRLRLPMHQARAGPSHTLRSVPRRLSRPPATAAAVLARCRELRWTLRAPPEWILMFSQNAIDSAQLVNIERGRFRRGLRRADGRWWRIGEAIGAACELSDISKKLWRHNWRSIHDEMLAGQFDLAAAHLERQRSPLMSATAQTMRRIGFVAPLIGYRCRRCGASGPSG